MKQQQNGFSLIELVVVIATIGILSYVMIPMIYTGVDNSRLIKEATQFTQTSDSFFLYFRPLLVNNGQITVAGENSMTFSQGIDSYEVSVIGYPGTPPYKIGVAKNAGTARLVGEKIAKLTSPDRPGFELTYFGQDNQATQVVADMKIVKIKLSYQGTDKVYTYQTSLLLSSDTITLENR